MVLMVFTVTNLHNVLQVLQLTCSQVRDFVDGHNSRRLRLAKGEIPNQPAASDMGQVVWDDELAAKASEWASHYKFSHNPDRSI
ncbi:jg13953, partial [Pararge aegeria aegeria]